MVAAGGMSAAARDRRRQASVLGLEGTGWDIGHAVRFLLSDYARYITGHTALNGANLMFEILCVVADAVAQRHT
jgi:hypothetical protein